MLPIILLHFIYARACNSNFLFLWLNPNKENQNIVLVDIVIYITQNNFNNFIFLISKDDFFLVNTVITA